MADYPGYWTTDGTSPSDRIYVDGYGDKWDIWKTKAIRALENKIKEKDDEYKAIIDSMKADVERTTSELNKAKDTILTQHGELAVNRNNVAVLERRTKIAEDEAKSAKATLRDALAEIGTLSIKVRSLLTENELLRPKSVMNPGARILETEDINDPADINASV
jgi:hypothetical protein